MKKLDWVAINWFDYPDLPKAILQIPISFDGIDQKQYLQLDTGCPDSILFGYQLSKLINENDSSLNNDEIYFNGSIGEHNFSNFKFKHLKNFGEKRAKQGQEKIGLLGTDFFNNKILVIDFIKNQILISDSLEIIDKLDYNFNFINTLNNPENEMIFNITLNNCEIKKILYDTGHSTSSLKFLKKKDWQFFVSETDNKKLIKDSIRTIETNFNSYRQKTKGILRIGKFIYNNPELAFDNNELSKESKLNGILGNKPFYNSFIILDFINFKFGVSR
ncbi:MAG: hypothetical protein P9M11_11095 [Candidatus Tenebribacter burtonii]|jgi:hypothetical protein|nr:hypothetical protein [Candidatus Tenebribacter burtonii]